MKDLFLELRSNLMAVPGIHWVDLNKGQINNYEVRPAIDFPAALITIALPRTIKLSRKEQQCDILITVDIIFDCMGDTDSITSDEALAESLAIYDTTKAVYKSLQGNTLNDLLRAPLERISQLEPRRADKLKVMQVNFSSRYIDTSANE